MSEGFSEARLNPEFSRGAEARSVRVGQIVSLTGTEERTRKHKHTRREFSISYDAATPETIEAYMALYDVLDSTYGFRYLDWTDYQSCSVSKTPTETDQPLGTGDGETTAFQLVKRYEAGFDYYDRPIRKPRYILVALDGVRVETWSADYTTGVITFDEAPAAGVEITTGFRYEVPVRFKEGGVTAAALHKGVFSAPEIVLVEDPRFLS